MEREEINLRERRARRGIA